MGLFLGLASANTSAETVYVTDMLQLGLHEDTQSEGRLLRNLVSGTELEVLDRTRGYARVRTGDGLVGWTKSAFLVEEKPPRLIVTELERQHSTLRAKLEITEQQLSSASEKMVKLEQRVAAATVLADEQTQAVELLRAENKQFREQLGRYGHSVPLAWVLTGLGATLTLGFLGGLVWLDRFIRRRHGGYRIY